METDYGEPLDDANDTEDPMAPVVTTEDEPFIPTKPSDTDPAGEGDTKPEDNDA